MPTFFHINLTFFPWLFITFASAKIYWAEKNLYITLLEKKIDFFFNLVSSKLTSVTKKDHFKIFLSLIFKIK